MHDTGQMKLVHIGMSYLVILHFNILTNLIPRVPKALTKNLSIFGLNILGYYHVWI